MKCLLIFPPVIFSTAEPLEGRTISAPRRVEIPYRPHWVTIVKKGRLFKYKRKEFSSPRVEGDRVFVGSDAGFFYAMKRKNGRKIWRFKTDGAVNSAPAFAAGHLFVGDDEGILYALGTEDGKELWRVSLGSEILTAPAVTGDRLLVATVEGRVAAVGLSGGEILWSREYPVDPFKMSIRGNSPPVVDEGRLYVGFSDGVLRSLAVSDGRLIWEKNLRNEGARFDDIDGAAAVEGDRLFIATFDGGVYAVSKRNGSLLWHRPVGSGAAILSHGDRLFLSGTDGHLHALGKKDGSEIWQVKLGSGALTAPVLYREMVAVGLSDETINFVRAADGHVIARRFARKGISSDPVISENEIYYLSNGGRVYSLTLK